MRTETNVFIVSLIKAFRLFEEETKNYVSIKVEKKTSFLLVHKSFAEAIVLTATNNNRSHKIQTDWDSPKCWISFFPLYFLLQ
jgi:hypothetical protein